jgi:hypothetical protein
MRATLNTIGAPEVERRGLCAILERLEQGPVRVIQDDQLAFVALKEEQFRDLVEELEESRLRSSLEDAEAGRVRWASAREILDEIAG